MLEDRQTHVAQNMKAPNTYRFQASKTDRANRFALHFGPVNNHPDNELDARIYSDGTHLIIDLVLVPQETEVYVYDFIGQLLFRQTAAGESRHILDFNADTQMLIVYLKNPDGTMCRKLFWAGNKF